MDKTTRTKFFKKLSSTKVEHKIGISFDVGCGAVDGALKHNYPDCNCLYYRPIFADETQAAQALMAWIQKNKFTLVKSKHGSFGLTMKVTPKEGDVGAGVEKTVPVTLKTCLGIVRKQTSISCYDVSDHVYNVSFSIIRPYDSINLRIHKQEEEDV